MRESLDSAELSSSDGCRKSPLLNLALPRSPDDEFKNCGKKEMLGSKLSPEGGFSCTSFELDLNQSVTSSYPQKHLKFSLSSFDHQEQQQPASKHTSTIFNNDRTNNSINSAIYD